MKASDNETVDKALDDFAYLITLGNIGPTVATDIKNRILAAHKREIAAKDAEIARIKACRDGDCFLIAFAPELYECLREAVIEMCDYPCCSGAPDYKCERNGNEDCFVAKWRAALAKAAGEGVK